MIEQNLVLHQMFCKHLQRLRYDLNKHTFSLCAQQRRVVRVVFEFQLIQNCYLYTASWKLPNRRDVVLLSIELQFNVYFSIVSTVFNVIPDKQLPFVCTWEDANMYLQDTGTSSFLTPGTLFPVSDIPAIYYSEVTRDRHVFE